MYKVVKRELDSGRGIVSQVIVAGKASGLGKQARISCLTVCTL